VGSSERCERNVRFRPIADIGAAWKTTGMAETDIHPAAPMWPYVLVGALVKCAALALLYLYATLASEEPPNVSTPITILAVGAAMAWYARNVNRPMSGRELVFFASGTAAVDLFLSALVLVLPILWAGENISMRTIDLVLGGDGSRLTTADLPWLTGVFIFTVLMVFALSLGLAWLLTRKLPRKPREKVAR